MNVIQKVVEREMIKFKEKHEVESVGREDFGLYSLYVIEGINSEGKKAFYVGITNDFKRRKREHFNPSNWKKEESKHLYNALALAKSENRLHEFKITETYTTFSSREILELEIALIAVLRKYFDVYNMTDGGEGTYGINGENHGMAVLTEEQVLRIGWLIENTTKTYPEIADEVGCNRNTVVSIAFGKSWVYLFPTPPYLSRPEGAIKQMDDGKAQKVIDMLHETKMSYKEISIICWTTEKTVENIAYGINFTNLYDIAPRLNRPIGTRGGYKQTKIDEKTAKLIVKEICETTKTYQQIADEFGTTKSNVTQIACGNSWKNLYDIPPAKVRKLRKKMEKSSHRQVQD